MFGLQARQDELKTQTREDKCASVEEAERKRNKNSRSLNGVLWLSVALCCEARMCVVNNKVADGGGKKRREGGDAKIRRKIYVEKQTRRVRPKRRITTGSGLAVVRVNLSTR